MYAFKETIEGDIICGANSKISIYLTDNCELKGKISIIGNGIVNIYVGGDKWELTDDSTVTNYQVDQFSKIETGGYTLTGTEVTNLTKYISDFPESTELNIDSISSTKVTCTNKVPSENNDDDGDDDDDDSSSKAIYIYINLLSFLFLFLIL